MASSFAHLCTRLEAVEEYERLKKTGLLNLNLKPMPYGDMIAIPTTEGELELDFQIIEKHNPHNLLNQILINPPKKWEKLGDLVIFQQGTDTSDWPLSKVANALGANKLAIQAEIDPGIKRQSNMKLILGNDGWVIHKENFIEYEFDATAVMFSSGNVTERRRMGQINTANETIVDAYCGVGYYTLPFLVNGGAKHVHACEINPDSISALQKGLARNNVSEKCTIHQGDNRKTMNDLRGIADRVILGLIPSSMNTWGLAINCLKPVGGIIHIHMNVHEREIEEWVEKTTDWFRMVSGRKVTPLHLEKVKWYCPHIRHVVLDIEIS